MSIFVTLKKISSVSSLAIEATAVIPQNNSPNSSIAISRCSADKLMLTALKSRRKI